MDLDDPNFFRLNYLCLNGINPLGSQSVIIEKGITKSDKIQRVKSGTGSISKKGSAPKYNKIDHTTNNLKERYSNNKKQILIRTKSNNRKVFNNIYQSYYTENNNIKQDSEYPIALSPINNSNEENKQKNSNINLYNEMLSKTNNKRYTRIGTETNYTHQNISSGNIINNNFVPLTEAKYNYLNNNNTYFHTNFVFKINNGNYNGKIYKGSSYRQTPNKKRSKNFKKFFDINSNNNCNNYNYNDNISNYNNKNINNNINFKHSINNKLSYEFSNNSNDFRNKNDIYKMPYQLDNNSCLIDNNSLKSDFNKIIKNKKGIKLIINTLRKENNSQNKIKIKNFNKNNDKIIKTNTHNLSIEQKGKHISRKNNLSDMNNSKIFKSNGGDIFDEERFNTFQLEEKNKSIIKNDSNINLNIKKTNIYKHKLSMVRNKELELQLEEYKSSNNELKNDNNILKTQLSQYENNIKINKKDINKLRNEIIKLTNENDTLKIVLKNNPNLKNVSNAKNKQSPPSIQIKSNNANTNPNVNTTNTTSNTNSNNTINNIKNKYMYIIKSKKELEEKNNILMKKNELYEKDIKDKIRIINEKKEIISSLEKQIEENKNRINFLEKNIEQIKTENDNLYKYKSLYDDKEIELIQLKNNVNKYKIDNNRYDSLKIEYDELLISYNKIKDIKDKYSSLIKDFERLKNIEDKYNDLIIKYNNLKEQNEEIKELKDIKNQYYELLKQNNKLNDIKNKYDKMKTEFDELKEIREKYGQILKEQKNLLIIENKYNDLIEEIKELREIKDEYEKITQNKQKFEINNIFEAQNISFGNENSII